MMFSVYRCWDADDVLLYVGCTGNLDRRLQQHRYGSRWWPLVARVTHTAHRSLDEARDMETGAIVNRAPRFNVALNSRRIDGAILRRTRIRAGLNQTQLADLAGVERTHLSRIESGQRIGTPAQFKALADALEVDMDDLAADGAVA